MSKDSLSIIGFDYFDNNCEYENIKTFPIEATDFMFLDENTIITVNSDIVSMIKIDTGQISAINKEIGGNRRSDRVGDHLCNRSECCAEHPEKFASVPHFEELPHRKTARLPPAVHTISGQSHEYADRRGDRSPESDRKPGLIILFASGNQRDDGKPRGHIPHRQNIPPCNSTRRQKVNDASRILPRVDGHPDQQTHRDGHNTPINPTHFSPLDLFNILLILRF